MSHTLSHPQEPGNPGPFRSILFRQPDLRADLAGVDAPEFFTDFNLDQIVASMTSGRDEYQLTPFFYSPLHDVETINYRHDII